MTDRGCFALPSTFSHLSAVCASCEARTLCAQKVLATLHRIRAVTPVNRLIAEFTAGSGAVRKLTLSQVTMVASMPVSLAGRLEALFVQGFDISARSQFANRINPFPHQGARSLRMAGDLLLTGPVTKTNLRQSYEQSFHWTKASAAVEVSRVVSLLRGLSLVVVTRSTIELAKNNS